MIQYRNMKRYTSFLSILAVVLTAGYAGASECIDDDCNFESPFLDEEVIEEVDVLQPIEHSENLWVETVSDDSDDKFDEYEIVEIDSIEEPDVCQYDDNCPFDTPTECAIWNKKPAYKTSVAPRAPHLSPIKTDGILYTLLFQGDISANDELAKPLLNRYQALMRASKQCCSEGILYKMRGAKAKDKSIYEFLKDDANQYGITSRCLVMMDNDIMEDYGYGVDGNMVSDVRNLCICKNRQWFDSLLEPFYDIYQRAPGFEYTPFFYTYLDGMQREVTVSVNEDVQNVMELLSYCPD